MTHSVAPHEIILIENITPQGAHVELEADVGTREAIANRLGVPGVVALKGAFEVSKSAGGVEVEGTIDAIVRRECVASLEIFDEKVRETFEIRFARGGSGGAEIEIDEETPEPLEGDTIDLGEILIQQLSLALDPYPRKPGAASLADAYAPEAKISPFSDLKAQFDAFDKRRDRE